MVRVAVIGTSRITENFIEAARDCKEFQLAAVYSRDLAKAQAFAAKYGAPLVFDDLQQLAKSPEVDGVYIASPNSLHKEQAIQMLQGKKHVLCEKPVASNKQELVAMLAAAKEHGVILLEAMRPIFDPGFQAVADNLGKLGKVRRVTFQYCQYSSRYDAFKKGIVENAFNPALSNGALMDIGVYCIHPLVKLFGLPKTLQAQAVFLENGLDGAGTIIAGYGDMQAELMYSKITNSALPSQIQGEKGCMLIREIPDTREITLIYRQGYKEEILIPKAPNNMYYEIAQWLQLIEQGGSPREYNQCSLLQMQVVDEVKRQVGIRFPADAEKGV